MKRKLLSVLLTFCLAFSLLPTAALAEGEEVAQIGETKYATLADAIAAASSGATVTLLADINTPDTSYYIDKRLTIDLKGKTVGVKTGTQGATYAESLKDEYGFDITYYEDSPTMYQAVLGGQCVACFEDTPIMKASIKDGGLALKVLDDTASDPAPYGFAIFSADSQELLDMFNAGLADIKANGKYDEILAKYLG